MKNLLIASAIALSCLAIPATSLAQDEEQSEPKLKKANALKDVIFYGDAGLGMAKFSSVEDDTVYSSDNMTTLHLRGGAKISYFGVEAEYGQGLSEYKEGGINIGVGSQTSVFGLVRYPSGDHDVYIRLGYHSSQVEYGAGNIQLDDKNTGIAFGVGGNYFFNDRFGVRADVTSYELNEPIDVSYTNISLGGVVKF